MVWHSEATKHYINSEPKNNNHTDPTYCFTQLEFNNDISNWIYITKDSYSELSIKSTSDEMKLTKKQHK